MVKRAIFYLLGAVIVCLMDGLIFKTYPQTVPMVIYSTLTILIAIEEKE